MYAVRKKYRYKVSHPEDIAKGGRPLYRETSEASF